MKSLYHSFVRNIKHCPPSGFHNSYSKHSCITWLLKMKFVLTPCSASNFEGNMKTNGVSTVAKIAQKSRVYPNFEYNFSVLFRLVWFLVFPSNQFSLVDFRPITHEIIIIFSCQVESEMSVLASDHHVALWSPCMRQGRQLLTVFLVVSVTSHAFTLK
jgi:hypothetical protein